MLTTHPSSAEVIPSVFKVCSGVNFKFVSVHTISKKQKSAIKLASVRAEGCHGGNKPIRYAFQYNYR